MQEEFDDEENPDGFTLSGSMPTPAETSAAGAPSLSYSQKPLPVLLGRGG